MTLLDSAEDTNNVRTPYTILAFEYQGGFEGNGSEFTETYKVTFKDHRWTTIDLFDYAEFPRRYQPAKDRRLAKLGYYVKLCRWSRNRDAPQICDLEVTLSNEVANSQQLGNKDLAYEPNPIKRAPIINYGTYTTKETIDLAFDKAGPGGKRVVPIQTTALEPIIYTTERKRRQITIESCVDVLPPLLFNEYEVVNSVAVKLPSSNSLQPATYSFPPETLRLIDMTATSEMIENVQRYFKITTVLQHKSEGWRFKPRNVGRQAFKLLNLIDPDTGRPVIKRSSTPSLIRIGNPPELPMNPLPLINKPDKPAIDGLVYPDWYNYDQTTKQFKFNQDPITKERLQEIYQEATLDFIVYQSVPLGKLIPGLDYYN
jgi:hypothetical protein